MFSDIKSLIWHRWFCTIRPWKAPWARSWRTWEFKLCDHRQVSRPRFQISLSDILSTSKSYKVFRLDMPDCRQKSLVIPMPWNRQLASQMCESETEKAWFGAAGMALFWLPMVCFWTGEGCWLQATGVKTWVANSKATLSSNLRRLWPGFSCVFSTPHALNTYLRLPLPTSHSLGAATTSNRLTLTPKIWGGDGSFSKCSRCQPIFWQ